MSNIYGDGIRDDTAGIQSLLDTHNRLVELPMPQEFYLISSPLRIYSDQELRLPALARIRLADEANCKMLVNADYENGNANIYINGGIWDQNNIGQISNPLIIPHPQNPSYDGIGLFFQNVTNLHLTHMTFKDPVTFAVTLDTVSYFTVENIVFDFNTGNPWAVNMDGIHLNGNCHFGTIRNLKGACYDDLVALNADEGTCGPITNIDIDGIFAEGCHSAVRLLSVHACVEHIHIHNVFGTYFQYCIGVTKYYPQETAAFYDGLSFDNIFASKAERLTVYKKDGSYVYPLLWIEDNLIVKNISITNVYRTEKITSIPTIYVGKNTIVETMALHNISCENLTGEPMPLFDNHGTVEKLFYSNLRTNGDELFAGSGKYPQNAASESSPYQTDSCQH